MNLGHLKIFYTVAQEQSFTRASTKLKVAQPSLSKTVRVFEETLGVKLLDRTTREVRLTQDGVLVFEHAQRIFDDVAKLERTLKRTNVSVKTNLHMGMTDALANHLAIPIAEYSSANNIYPIIQTGSASEIADLVLRRKIEFALLFHTPQLSENLKSEAVAKLRFNLVASKPHAKNPQTINCFIGSREVDDEGIKRFPTLELYRKKNPEASIQFSSNSLLAHLTLVEDGKGISVLPNFLVKERLARKALTDLLPEERLEFQVKLISHRSFGLTPNANRCVEHLLKYLV